MRVPVFLITGLTTLTLMSAGDTFAQENAAAVQVVSVPGFQALTPHLSNSSAGLNLAGGFCRTSSFAARPVLVRVQRLNAEGAVIGEEHVRVFGATGNRSHGCGYYSTTAKWTLEARQAIRVSAVP